MIGIIIYLLFRCGMVSIFWKSWASSSDRRSLVLPSVVDSLYYTAVKGHWRRYTYVHFPLRGVGELALLLVFVYCIVTKISGF